MSDARLDNLAAAYRRDGFIAVERLLQPEEVEDLKAEAFDIATGRRGAIRGARAQGERTPDEVHADVLAIHFPHKVSQPMRAAMRHPAVVEILTALIGPNVKAMQTIMFGKAPGMPGQAWHQMSTSSPPATARSAASGSPWTTRRCRTAASGSIPDRKGRESSGAWGRTPTRGSTPRRKPTTTPSTAKGAFLSNSRRAGRPSSTATCCTAPCPTGRRPGSGGPWSRTT
jgi:hypothetical protein